MPGRVALKLKSMLEAEGFEIDNLTAVQGWDRSNSGSDTYRWSATGELRADSRHNSRKFAIIPVTIDSWDTMTKCTRNGFTIDVEQNKPWSFEVHAK